jgi:hypothetical protein
MQYKKMTETEKGAYKAKAQQTLSNGRLLFGALGITSVYTIQMIVGNSLHNKLGVNIPWFINLATAIITIVAYAVIDGRLHEDLLEFIQNKAKAEQTKDRAHKILSNSNLISGSVRFTLSVFLSVITSLFIADMVYNDPSTANIEQAVEQQNEQYNKALEAAKLNVSALEKAYNEAKRQKRIAVNAAIDDHKNPDVPRDYRRGHEWVLKTPSLRRYRSKIKATERKHTLIVEKAFNSWQNALQAQTDIANGGGLGHSQQNIEFLTKQFEEKKAKTESMESTLAGTLYLLDFIIGFFCLFNIRKQYAYALIGVPLDIKNQGTPIIKRMGELYRGFYQIFDASLAGFVRGLDMSAVRLNGLVTDRQGIVELKATDIQTKRADSADKPQTKRRQTAQTRTDKPPGS